MAALFLVCSIPSMLAACAVINAKSVPLSEVKRTLSAQFSGLRAAGTALSDQRHVIDGRFFFDLQ